MRLSLALFLAMVGGTLTRAATAPANITKTVLFIYNNADGAPNHADGTGFLIGIPVAQKDGPAWVYLVTAQHVLHTDPNNLSSPTYPRLF
ncbi:MAG TPA: hypothetical protein VMF66_07870, partial [Candidatus Acidoferrum sp.]|nr:hypothetical protein [Candidatus Acidoferrum sp.]